MYLENLVFDAVDPARLGRFWEDALGGVRLTDSEDLYETRLSVPGGPDLDLCFQRVPARPAEELRQHLDLSGAPDQPAVVERVRALGAVDLDIGQGEVDWVVLADPEGNAFCVLDGRGELAETGIIAALPIDSVDAAEGAAFWSWLAGWVRVSGAEPETLRHRSMRGLSIEFWPESQPKPTAKNRMHLDIRLEADDDLPQILAQVIARGGRELHPGWGELPWTVCADPSGNEFCLLPAARSHPPTWEA